MTIKSKFPVQIYQSYFPGKESFDSLLVKLEVLSDSNIIIYSVRVLIVVLALVMGYVHTPKEKKDFQTVKKIELLEGNAKPIFEHLNKSVRNSYSIYTKMEF